MAHFFLPASHNYSQTAQRISRAQRKKPVTTTDTTFSQLVVAMETAMARTGKSPQVLSNHLTAMKAFMADHGFSAECAIGSHLRAAYYRRLGEHVTRLTKEERSTSYIANRKNLLGHWRSLLLQMDRERAANTGTFPPFQIAIRELLSEAGGIKKLAKNVGISHSALQRWSSGTTPQTSSIPKLRRLESYFGMEPGALVCLLGGEDVTPAVAPITSNAINYRKRISQFQQNPFRLKIISDAFKIEWSDFVSYKTSLLPSLERQARGRWDLTEHTTFVANEALWYCFVDSKYCPTATIHWTALTRYCGWLTLQKTSGGAELPSETVQTLTCVLAINHLSNYIQWLVKRADGKIHEGIIGFIKFVKSLVHPITGYLTQSPHLAASLHVALSRDIGWPELCAKAFEWTKKTLKQLTPRQKQSRDTFEPIKAILELSNPMEEVSDMVQRMKTHRPSTGGLTEAIWARDLLLIKLLASNPLRAKNMKLLSYRDDNSGQLRQTTDGSWRIVIPPEYFKNQAGAAKDRPYDMPVDEALWSDLERYIKRYRPLLPHARETDYVFLSADGEAATKGWETLNRRVFHLTKHYLLNCPGVGPHAFRYINGTAILKAMPGAWEIAAQVLHDKEDTVRKHYAHLRGTDGAERAHAALRSAFARM
ncbi:MAG: hypothetical protein D3M94_07835 [Rhodocyclales bacterium GT-UBC]|nr:MAG: hypothetical protein D3M94_07835 [Rhodocyclales bacterium GT-UBC]